MVGLAEEVSSSMVLEPRSWIQFLPPPLPHTHTKFSAAHIPPSLASVGPIGTAAPEQEQEMPTSTVHM
jgi:hypothetical protein